MQKQIYRPLQVVHSMKLNLLLRYCVVPLRTTKRGQQFEGVSLSADKEDKHISLYTVFTFTPQTTRMKCSYPDQEVTRVYDFQNFISISINAHYCTAVSVAGGGWSLDP
jgi:hypothetical protein